ncbi:hypothetical protein JCM8115_004847 [Rhodotorula mucilaginosa]|uniref:Major facilitator superfamily (MFS) profile domain-containing protein n=1 Tax=Rhodotorula mucilaginosa TaxID=5537 RepID=A0A9P7B7E5_RHOMI|nr:hypothetical protein C6P46_003408 [Rhodotorula mucilaginosa]TKA57165.1 hypothetical protein B0A53_01121 [Rhodotorula sp. CCFEE 5036]
MALDDTASLEKGSPDLFPDSGQQSVASEDAVASTITYTAEEEQRVLRKVDWALLPGLTLLYLLSFLDRSNIGNAKLLGLMKDIGLAKNPAAYNTSLALYFLGYVLFEIPANMVLKKFNPKVWLPTLTVAWGITATLQCLIKNEPGFYAARFFLGVSEAGLFPGIIFVFSLYYKRNERHWRVGVFFGGAALAGALGGILAWGIGHINGGGLPSWAWIFAIEGIFTVIVGVTAYWWVPGYPKDATFLNEREHAILIDRLRKGSDSADNEPFNWAGVWDAFKDPWVIGYGMLFHFFAFTLYSLSLFLPTIIAQLGYASWRAQLMTVPVYAAAFACIMLSAWISHRVRQRGSIIVAAGAVAIVGYIVLLTTHTAGARYAGAFIAVAGIYSANGLLLSWPSENVSPQTKRAVSSGMQIFIGDVGAIVGVLVFRPSLAHDFYRIPQGISILYTGLGMVLAAVLSITMARANRNGNAARAAAKERAGVPAIGDRAREYRFQI